MNSVIAKWIWLNGSENNTQNTWMAFRKKIKLTNSPKGPVYAKIAVDSKYWLYINGETVVFEGQLKRGPTPDDTYFDRVDISPYLKAGENIIGVLVWYFGKSGYSHISSGQGGLLFDAECNEFSIKSDSSWKAKKYNAYGASSIQANYRLPETNLLYNAVDAIEMEGWQYLSYDDQNWAYCKEFGTEGSAPWNKLYERPIPQWKNDGIKLFDDSQISKTIVSTTGKGSALYSDITSKIKYTCKLPTNMQFTPYFKVNATAGKTITITTNATYQSDTAAAAQYVTKDGIQSYESLGWMNGYYMYVEVPEDVEVIEIGYRHTGYDTFVAGSFKCNDEFYNTLWQKSADTLLVTMRDNYMDCPNRERAQWWGDAVNEFQEAFYSLSRSSDLLTKKGIHNIIDWKRPDDVLLTVAPCSSVFELPVQVLAGITGYYTYYEYTGDYDTLAYVYPDAVKYLKLFNIGSDGVIEHRSGTWDWTDWGSNQDKKLLINTFYYMAIDRMIKAAEVLKIDDDLHFLLERKYTIKKNFDAVFWNSDGYYRTKGLSITDDRANAMAVCAGLVPKERYSSVEQVLKTVTYASPYMEKYVLEAMFKMGYAQDALARMKQRYKDMVESEIPTLWELWTTKGGTTNHAWAGGPLTLLSMYVAGIAPINPGFTRFSVVPQMGGLTEVHAVVPSVKGDIKLSLQNSGYIMNFNVPRKTTAVVGVLRGEQNKIAVNGVTVWENGKAYEQTDVKYLSNDKNYVYFELGDGEWNIKSL